MGSGRRNVSGSREERSEILLQRKHLHTNIFFSNRLANAKRRYRRKHLYEKEYPIVLPSWNQFLRVFVECVVGKIVDDE